MLGNNLKRPILNVIWREIWDEAWEEVENKTVLSARYEMTRYRDDVDRSIEPIKHCVSDSIVERDVIVRQ